MTASTRDTTTTTSEITEAGSDSAARVAALAAVGLGACLFLTVALIDVPHDVTDAELVAWWQEPANRRAGVLSGFAAVVVAICAAVVRHRLGTLSDTRSSAWMAFARTMATAVACLWLVTGAVRASIGQLVDALDEPLPGADVLRMVTALNYTLLGLSGMAALGLMILGVSVAGLRTGALGRLFCWLGVGCAAVVLGAVTARYGAYASPVGILWALGLGAALWRVPSVPSA